MIIKIILSKIFSSSFALAFLIVFSSNVGAASIKIGHLVEVKSVNPKNGLDYAYGIFDAVRYVNEMGGVNGKEIKLYAYDYKQSKIEAIEKYKLFKRIKCSAILGWNDVDTLALIPYVNKDKIPYISAIPPPVQNLKAPYNLCFSSKIPTRTEDKIPLMERIVSYAKKYRSPKDFNNRTEWTIKAWNNVLILWEALKLADKTDDLSGESILTNGFKTIKNQ